MSVCCPCCCHWCSCHVLCPGWCGSPDARHGHAMFVTRKRSSHGEHPVVKTSKHRFEHSICWCWSRSSWGESVIVGVYNRPEHRHTFSQSAPNSQKPQNGRSKTLASSSCERTQDHPTLDMSVNRPQCLSRHWNLDNWCTRAENHGCFPTQTL